MTIKTRTWGLVLLSALALAACDKGVQAHPDAPGSSGMKGSFPHSGSSGGDAVPGTTGGGLGGSSGLGMTGSFPASSAAQPSNAVGNR